jgi:hypothetical protein
MEEQKNIQEKLSYEKLEEVAVQLQQRCAMLENKLRSIDLISIRLNYLFKVLDYKSSFSLEFINKCSDEIEEILTVEEESKSEE